MTRLAALIVGYFSSGEVAPMVSSLRDSIVDESLSVEVHVIDNSGDAAEAQRLREIPGVDRVLASEDNRGYGGGMNALADQVEESVEWLLVCNPDIRFDRASIDTMIEVANRHTEAGLVGPLIRDSAGGNYPSARSFPSVRTGVGHVLFSRLWPSNPWTARYHRGGGTAAPVERQVDWLSGACLLVRADTFRGVGGFDEGYFMYFEDVDLAWRLRELGLGARFVPAATITHSGAHSTSKRARVMRVAHHRSASRFMGKRYGRWWQSPLRWAIQSGLWFKRTLG